MAMFIDVSRNMSMISPKIMADDTESPSDPEFGRKHITIIATNAPTNRYGRRRPKRFHVRSDIDPITGCTISPIRGGSTQK